MFLLTAWVDFVASVVSLWLGLYLLGRGSRSRITLRAFVVLLALATFFLGAYLNLYLQISGIGNMRGIMLTVGLPVWLDVATRMLSTKAQESTRWPVQVAYLSGFITLLFIFFIPGDALPDTIGTSLLAGRSGVLSLPFILDSAMMMATFDWILYASRSDMNAGPGPRARYLLIAWIFAALMIGYISIFSSLAPFLSRLLEDTILFATIVLVAVSMARHQTLVERRTILQEAPISALVVFGLAAIYASITWQLSHSPILLILAALLAVLTHAIYDLAREFLDRLRRKSESEIRNQLRQLEKDVQAQLSPAVRLQEAISRLCEILDASGGIIAGRQDGEFIVLASHHSIQTGSELPLDEAAGDAIYAPPQQLGERIAWLAPALAGDRQVAVIGLGHPKTRSRYSEDELDLLAEAADRVARIVYLHNLQTGEAGHLGELVSNVRSRQESLRLESDGLMTTLITNPDPGLVTQVEQSLRNLSDFITLGQNPLSRRLGLAGETNIETGKALRERLVRAIEMLRPEPSRPEEPLPREWHSYVVLHDAYIRGVPNREIMTRLYISESTFNRTRRKALRGVARLLLEKEGQAN